MWVGVRVRPECSPWGHSLGPASGVDSVPALPWARASSWVSGSCGPGGVQPAALVTACVLSAVSA